MDVRPLFIGIAGSNPAGEWMSVSCECCAQSGLCFCDGPIPRLEESHRVRYVLIARDLEISIVSALDPNRAAEPKNVCWYFEELHMFKNKDPYQRYFIMRSKFVTYMMHQGLQETYRFN